MKFKVINDDTLNEKPGKTAQVYNPITEEAGGCPWV